MDIVNSGVLDISQWATRYVFDLNTYVNVSERILDTDTAIGDWFSGSQTSDFIVDAKYFPIDFKSYAGATTDVGTFFLGKSGYPASDLDTDKVLALDYDYVSLGYNHIRSNPLFISKHFTTDKEFLNYQIGLELFVPYVGFIRLNPVDVINKYITATYIVDVSSGKATVVIHRYDNYENANSGLHGIMISNHSCVIGTSLTTGGQITTSRDISRAVSIIGTVVGGIAGGVTGATVATTVTSGMTTTNTWQERNKATGRLVTAAKSTMEEGGRTTETTTTHKSKKPPTDIGVGIFEGIGRHENHYRGNSNGGGDFTWYDLPQNLILVKTIPNVSVPNDYFTLYGYPCNKSFSSLQQLKGTGFTSISNVHMEGFITATESEISEVEDLLMNGVIL